MTLVHGNATVVSFPMISELKHTWLSEMYIQPWRGTPPVLFRQYEHE